MSTEISATDPVCGMQVNPSQAPQSDYDGTSYFFCSDGCQKAFEEDPNGVLAQQAKRGQGQAEESKASGGCCGHGSGNGERPQAKRPSAGDEASAIYTCPMHPEVEQVGPGDCPICGMDLADRKSVV